MIGKCQVCGTVVREFDKLRCVDCPICGTYDTLKRITRQEADKTFPCAVCDEMTDHTTANCPLPIVCG